MYALNIAEDGRILSATFTEYVDENQPVVDSLPDGNIADYLYVDGEYIYVPLQAAACVEAQPTQLDRIEAQLTYTAMMTDTLLEV